MPSSKIVTADKAVATYQVKGMGLVQRFEGKEIETPKDMEDAGVILSELNKIVDAAEEEKQKVLKPLNAARAAELARWKPFETYFKPIIEVVRGKISKYQTAATRAADEEAARIALRVGEGKGKLKVETAVRKIDEIDKPASVIETSAGKVKFREDKVLKITDMSKLMGFVIRTQDFSFVQILDAKLKARLVAGEEIPGAEIEVVQTPINFR